MKDSELPLEKIFPLTRDDLGQVLTLALSRGGEFSDIFLEHRVHHVINMEEDIIKETSESVSLGLGIRVISGDMTGYGCTNDLSLEKVKKVARTAGAVAAEGRGKRLGLLRPTLLGNNFYPLSFPADKARLEEKISLVKRTYEAAQDVDRKIKKVKVIFLDQRQTLIVADSDGNIVSDERPLVKLTCASISEKGKRREVGFFGGGGRVGLEYFSKDLSPERIGRAAAQESLHLLEAADPPAGEMPVVLAPGHSGVLIHEAVGHLLEADFIRRKTSVFWDKMGKKIGSGQLNIYDDPTMPHFRGSYNIDDEGTVPERIPLIQGGKMVGLLQDKLSARLMGMPLTGHGRRQDYTGIPLPRMSNTYVDRGEFDPEEIIRSVQKGFYAHKFQGGQVEDSGKFTFSVSSGFLIEDGRLTAPVRQATLVGSNIDILKRIDKLGSDLEFGLQTGICGKGGQGVPVNDGCPTIKIRKMTVGGRL